MMKIGYKYLGVILPSVSDCEEMELSIYQEKVYNYAMRRIAEGRIDWQERVNRFETDLKKRMRNYHWQEVVIMD